MHTNTSKPYRNSCPKLVFSPLIFFLFIHHGQNTSRSKWLNWHHLKQVHRMILGPGFHSKGWNQLILSPRTRGRCSRYRGRGTRYSGGGILGGAVGRSTGGPLSGPAGPRSTPVGPWSRSHRSGSTVTNQTSSNNIHIVTNTNKHPGLINNQNTTNCSKAYSLWQNNQL